jgi:hypothetical protein
MIRHCFVAMPFRGELNYFYLYLKRYLEETFGLRVTRGDATILTRPLMEKIRDQILKADLVIGDVTGGNPNVFYELGLAHASGKPVLFLTQESPDEAPVDIRQFEFIRYDLGRHEEFLGKLDKAIQGAFGARYEALYEEATALLQRFNGDTGLQCKAKEGPEFQALVMKGEQAGGIPSEEEPELRAQFLLPKIIADFTDLAVIKRYSEWVAAL